MRFSQLVALVLVFGLTLSFDVSAKPSWKDTGSTTEKPGGKKNRGTTTDPVEDTTTDTDPVVDTTTDTTTTDPVVDTTTDTTTTDPVVDTTTDTTTTDPVVDTTEPAVSGTATITWDIPVSRENGDYLQISELNGYKVLVRDTANNAEYFVMITDPTITQWDFVELTSGTWEFSIASIDTQGIYSSYSSVISKTFY